MNYWHTGKSLVRAIFTLIILGALVSCAVVTPKTNDLYQVHSIYQREFASLMVPAPGSNLKPDPSTSFNETLVAIRNYKAKYAGLPEAMHLTVLEAMIYLQSRQFGMASLLQQEVSLAVEHLPSGTGRPVRDRLLARAFPYLLKGWQVIDRGGTDPLRELAFAVEGIRQVLRQEVGWTENGFNTENTNYFFGADDGGIYVATSAAIFNVHIISLQALSPSEPAAKKLFAEGAALIGPFLSQSERAASSSLQGSSQVRNSRLRYISWYSYLNKNSQ
ncbi:MAG: hypothetical protein AAF984_05225 [Verrucomicrobiota bacterium]